MSDERLVQVFLDEATELVRRATTAGFGLASAADPSEVSVHGSALLRDLHTLKGAAAGMGRPTTDAMAAAVHGLEDRLQAAGVARGEALSEEAADELLRVLDELGAALGRVRDPSVSAPSAPASASVEGLHLFEEEPAAAPSAPPPPTPEPAPAAREGDLVLRVRVERVEAAHAAASELLSSRIELSELAADAGRLRDHTADLEARLRQVAGLLRDRRDVLGSDGLHLAAGIERVRRGLLDLTADATALARRTVASRDRTGALAGSVEEAVRHLRVMPVQPFLDEFQPVVREAARHVGRSVRLVTDGAGAEVDRHALVTLREGLLHLLRNAVVHGIEDAGVRAAAGKPARGTLTLTAQSAGARLRLELRDDGRGIDVARVVAKARALGIEASDRPDDTELLDLLCRPGLSTAERVDGLAGRGVGMDVVAAGVRTLGGTLRVHDAPGAGVTWSIDVPITATASAGLVVEVADAPYALLLSHVERVIRVSAPQLARGAEAPWVTVDGEPVALVHLAHFVGGAPRPLGPDRTPAVVLRVDGARVALLVDDVPGDRDLVIKPLPAAFARESLLVGGAIQADDSVLQVLDASEIVNRVRRAGVPRLVVEEVAA